MSLSKRDREFRLPKISYLDFKHLEMDRVLTAFFARLAHNGYPSRLTRNFELSVDAFVEFTFEHPEWFTKFQDNPDVVRRWVETHLLDLVNRGKANEALAAPRPLHGFTYRFRNPKHSRDYGAAQHLYEMLYMARKGAGQKALEHLHHFFFQGHDKVTGKANAGAVIDVETQALLRLLDEVKGDAPDTKSGRDSFSPLCVGAADLLAEDIQRLLFYQRFIPRSVMVEYLKVLIAFHLGLYHLRLLKLLPALVRKKGCRPDVRDGCVPNERQERWTTRSATAPTEWASSSTSPASPVRRWQRSRSAARTPTTAAFRPLCGRTSRRRSSTSSPPTSFGVGSSRSQRAATSRSVRSCSFSTRR
jgi:hypothetical protein